VAGEKLLPDYAMSFPGPGCITFCIGTPDIHRARAFVHTACMGQVLYMCASECISVWGMPQHLLGSTTCRGVAAVEYLCPVAVVAIRSCMRGAGLVLKTHCLNNFLCNTSCPSSLLPPCDGLLADLVAWISATAQWSCGSARQYITQGCAFIRC
jgi:hypothetical protein